MALTSSMRNTFGCNLVNQGGDFAADTADKIRELSLKCSELGVQSSIR